METSHQMLRHALATLAYRASKSVRGAGDDFGAFRAQAGTRTPVEILAHLGDLMEWGLTLSRGKPEYKETTPKTWAEEVARFFTALTAWDTHIAEGAPHGITAEKIFQGPIADALTHVGQINLLRGMSGARVRGESYARAEITLGQTSLEQPPPLPGSEFD